MHENFKIGQNTSKATSVAILLVKVSDNKSKTKPKENITKQWIYYPKRINKLFQWDEFWYLFENKTKQKNDKQSFKPFLGKQQNLVFVTKPAIQVTRAATSKTTHCIVIHTTQF